MTADRYALGGITLVSGLCLGLTLVLGIWLFPPDAAVAGHQNQQPQQTEQQSEQQATQQAAEAVPPSDAPMSVWMEKKLKYSQELLRLLAIGDLQELRITAQRMQLVSKVEGFVRSNNPTYTDHLRSFQLANQELIRQADRKNIEGATLAFNQLTGTCVACHVVLRQSAATEPQ